MPNVGRMKYFPIQHLMPFFANDMTSAAYTRSTSISVVHLGLALHTLVTATHGTVHRRAADASERSPSMSLFRQDLPGFF